MPEPTDEQILVFLLLPFLKKAKADVIGDKLEQEIGRFTLDDLVGKKIEKVTKIKNPLPYNPEWASANPRNFIVIGYSDGSYLLHMRVGHHDFTTHHTFLIEDGVRYTSRLYSESFLCD
jgi:hypothetical protein